MKKTAIIIFFALCGIASVSKSQTIIVRPPAAVMVHPPCPGPGYVWFNPYRRWNRRMNAYVWVNGYWGRPRGWRHGYRF